MSIAEDILATLRMAAPARADQTLRLEAETRLLIAECELIDESVDPCELKLIAREALDASERLRFVVEGTPLRAGHPLRALYDEFSDIAEVFALSVDPQTAIDLEAALEDRRQGLSIPWEKLREPVE